MPSFNVVMSLAFAAGVSAVQFTNSNYDVKALVPFNITWSGNTGPVTIWLEQGEPSNLQDLNTIVAGATGNSFNWLPSKSLSNQQYALKIEDDGENDPNFSPLFDFTGGEDRSSSSVSGSASASTAASTSIATTVVSVTTAAANSTVTSVSNSTAVSSGSSASKTASTTASGSGSSSTSGASSSPSASATGTSDAGRLASPAALILAIGGVLAFFN